MALELPEVFFEAFALVSFTFFDFLQQVLQKKINAWNFSDFFHEAIAI